MFRQLLVADETGDLDLPAEAARQSGAHPLSGEAGADDLKPASRDRIAYRRERLEEDLQAFSPLVAAYEKDLRRTAGIGPRGSRGAEPADVHRPLPHHAPHPGARWRRHSQPRY